MDSETLEFFLNLDAERRGKLYQKAMELCLRKELLKHESLSFGEAKRDFMQSIVKVVMLERARCRFIEWSSTEGVLENLRKIEKETLERNPSM